MNAHTFVVNKLRSMPPEVVGPVHCTSNPTTKGKTSVLRGKTSILRTQTRERDMKVYSSAIGMGSMHRFGDLSTYDLPLQSHRTREHVRPAPWFEGAIEEIVKQLQSSAFIQTIKLGNNPHMAEDMRTYLLEDCETNAAAWGSVAKTLECDTADAVILVQKITESSDFQALDGVAPPPSDVSVSDACKQLISSGVAQSILRGRVGECCDSSATSSSSVSDTVIDVEIEPTAVSRNGMGLPSLPVAAGTKSRSPGRPCVKVTALPAGDASHREIAPFHGYWGVVVQSKSRTGVEGCYLLKAGRSIVKEDGHGCSCTHFSLTKISQQGDIHQQFLDSWQA